MNQKRIVRIIALILAVLLLLGVLITPALAAENSGSSSLGIIGGADGPTAIFVTTSPSGIVSTLLLIAGAICGAVAIIRFIKKRKK